VLHVPLIIAARGLIPPGIRITDPVSHLDLVPTLLDLAGLPQMKGALGRSLKPTVLQGARVPPRPIVSETRELMALRLGNWKYIYRHGGARLFRGRGGLGPQRQVVHELYDLSVDPQETVNLARQHPERVRRMRTQLLAVLRPKRAGNGALTRATTPVEPQGLRLSIRLWGGRGKHRLQGTLSCRGRVRVRGLQGTTSRAALPGLGSVAVLLENRAGRPALVDLEFLRCPVTTIRLDLKLDDKPLRADQLIVGPFGLRLLRATTSLPPELVPALRSRTPPPVLASRKARVHLWVGSGGAHLLDLDGAGHSQAARAANKMLQDAGYAKSPGNTFFKKEK
jgi:hypothetical protein